MEALIVIALGYAIWKGVSAMWSPIISGKAYESKDSKPRRPIAMVKSNESEVLKNSVRQNINRITMLLEPYEKLNAVDIDIYMTALDDIERYVLDCMTRRRELTELVDYIRVRSVQSELQRYKILDATRYRNKIEVLQERIDIKEDADRRSERVSLMIDDAMDHLDKVITSLSAMQTNIGSDDHFERTIRDLDSLIVLSGKLNAYSSGMQMSDDIVPVTLTTRAAMAN